ncbi:MAG: tetratricopeptide repeat protein [Caldisericaceae bacterium]|nr:tetratricopeptide repeat protein [Caldisericaceae bacterium]
MKKRHLIFSLLTLILLSSCIHYSQPLQKGRAKEHSVSFKARDHFLQGIYYQQEGRYSEALVEFYQALHYDSTSATIYRAIAENYINLGEFETAELMLKKARQLAPDNPDILEMSAEIALRLGKDDQAIQFFERLLKVNPFDNEAREMLILLYQKKGDDLAVARHTKILIDLYGKNKDLLYRLTQIYLRNKNFKQAVKTVKSILQLDSTDARAYYFLGLTQEQKLNTDSAAFYYKKAVRFEPKFAQPLDRLSFILRTKKDWPEIIKLYQYVLSRDSSSVSARVLIAEAYFYLNKYDSARVYLQPLLKRPKMPPGVYELAGRIELEEKNYPLAEQYFKKAIQIDSDNRLAWLLLAFTYSDMGQTARADSTYRQLLNRFPKDATFWAFYGNFLQEKGQYQKSIAAFKKVLELDPKNEAALSGLAIVYENLKMFAQCDSIYEIALQRLPDNPLILNNFSYSLAERDKALERALQMAKKAVELEPNNAAYLDTYGWVLYKLGKYEQAAKFIKQSIELRGNSAVVIEHLGDVYKAMGDLQNALFYWQKASELDPKNENLKQKIKENQL